ncbi:hypothetical protein AB1Y20_003680 [Prymnesium parvum]|uniref:F5/8 type C domain-containing protein n=1 Tax=Prymnesium parvum TaxID=97485 RepID=A0AB34J5Y6_PRYPA
MFLLPHGTSSGLAHISLPQHGYDTYGGYLPSGADLVNGSMTVVDAQRVCNSMADCMGFTSVAIPGDAPSVTPTQIYLKASNEWVTHESHLSFIKKRPECLDVSLVRYRRSGAGPYCCEGANCPAEHAFAAAELHCSMPASAPYGAPLCTSLRGDPLQNLAVTAKASAQSQWSYAENAGLSVVQDGIIDASTFFHSRCDSGPQWFRLTFQTPMVLYQIALHNRPDFKARLVGARLQVSARNGTTLATIPITSARSMYVWTIRPTVLGASQIELQLPSKDGCLHFVELETFGMSVDEFKSGKSTFGQEPPKSPGGAHTLQDSASRGAPINSPNAAPDASSETRASSASYRGDSLPTSPPPPSLSNEPVRAVLIASDDSVALRMATTTSATTMVLVALQVLWVKMHWINIWQ